MALEGLPRFVNENLLFGSGAGDDAGVFRLREDLALVQTVDFFTPIVDDPYEFGVIAAANALSDCFVLGAQPVTALNLVGFPKRIGLELLHEILRGGAETVHRAGAVVIGGHTVEDAEPKYGLAVTGVVDPRKMITNDRARPGDRLILTKCLGTGIVANLWKNRQKLEANPGLPIVPEEVYRMAVQSMMTLNDVSARLMVQFGATACTDVTGFGLAGHAHNVALASGVEFHLQMSALPQFPGVFLHAEAGTKGGGDRNKAWVRPHVRLEPGCGEAELSFLCDPQTSGPLLIAIPDDSAEALVRALRDAGVSHAALIGEVAAGEPGAIVARR